MSFQESFEISKLKRVLRYVLFFYFICPLCICFINGIFKYMEILFYIDQLFYIMVPGLISFSESLLHSMIINNHPDIILLYLLSLNVKIIESSRLYMWRKEFLPYFPSILVTSHPIIIVIMVVALFSKKAIFSPLTGKAIFSTSYILLCIWHFVWILFYIPFKLFVYSYANTNNFSDCALKYDLISVKLVVIHYFYFIEFPLRSRVFFLIIFS